MKNHVVANCDRFSEVFRFQLNDNEKLKLVTNCDRYLIIDDSEIYHFGASLKDLGKKWFAFSKMDKSSFALKENLKKVMADE